MNGLRVAYACGTVATVCAVAQYVPQLLLNHRRRSTVGLSAPSIILKLAGASVLLFNALFLGEAAPVVLYGLGNIATHTLFMVQFHIYAPAPPPSSPSAVPAAPKTLRARATAFVAHYRYLLWTLFPLVPLVVDTLFPAVIRLLLLLLLLLHSHTPCCVFLHFFFCPKHAHTHTHTHTG